MVKQAKNRKSIRLLIYMEAQHFLLTTANSSGIIALE